MEKNKMIMRLMTSAAALAATIVMGGCATTSTGTSTFLGLSVSAVQTGVANTCGVIINTQADVNALSAILASSVPGIATADAFFVYLCKQFAPTDAASRKFGGRYGGALVGSIIVQTVNGPITIPTAHK